MWSRAISFERGHLTIDGLSARDLAAEFATPTFFIDEEHFRDRARAWAKSLSLHFGESAGEVYYAAKAFICTDVARWIKEEGIGIDVCTGGELAVALAGGIDPKKIEAKKVNFKYGLGAQFITTLKTIHMLGLDRKETVEVQGIAVSPRDLLAASLPDPATLGERMHGKTCAGTLVKGLNKEGKPYACFLTVST